MIEQSTVHLPELLKDIDRPVSIYLVHLSRRGVRNPHLSLRHKLYTSKYAGVLGSLVRDYALRGRTSPLTQF
jgi:hypothetical protein